MFGTRLLLAAALLTAQSASPSGCMPSLLSLATSPYGSLGGLTIEPEISLSASQDYANLGDTVTFTAIVSGSGGPYTYFWQLDGDGAWTSGGSTFSRVMDSLGTRSVYFVARDANGNDSDSYSMQVYVMESGAQGSGGTTTGGSDPTASSITASISASATTANLNDVLSFSANASGGTSPYTYYWAVDDGSWQSSSSSSYSVAMPHTGYVSVWLAVIDARGVESDATGVDVYVAEEPTATSGSVEGCWSTTYFTMRLTVSGAAVSGTYDYYGGTISGATLSGHTLTGTWAEPEAPWTVKYGPFELNFSDDWTTFSGVWGFEGSGTWNGSWDGTRVDCD